MAGSDPTAVHNLTALLASTASASTVSIPSDDSLVSVLQSRYRNDLFATYLGDTTLVQVNPLRATEDVNDERAEWYAAAYRPGTGGETRQPHLYDLAARVFLTMRRTGKSQGVVYTGVSGSGKSTSMRLLTNQLIRLSSTHDNPRSPSKIADQLPHLFTLLRAFTTARSSPNISASRVSTLLETHFASFGSLQAAKCLVFGLDKTRLRNPLPSSQDRTFDIFYALIAGTSSSERSELALLDDASQYDLLASSNVLRNPEAPDADGVLFSDVREALRSLGFKSKHVTAIFRLLSAILMLGNLEFADYDSKDFQDQSAFVVNRDALAAVAALLGLTSEDLERTLTNQVRYVKKETITVLLKPEAAKKQRDDLMTALYGIVVAYVVETANHKLFPGDDMMEEWQAEGSTSIVQLDVPGLQGRTEQLDGSMAVGQKRGSQRQSTLLDQASTFGASGFTEFCINYQTELLQAWLTRRSFSNDSDRAALDGVPLPPVEVMDSSSARLELLRGGLLGGKADTRPGGVLGGLAKTASSFRKGKYPSTEDADNDVLDGMRGHFASHSSFISRPSHSTSQNVFGIAHWASAVSYDVAGFVEEDLGMLDVEFVSVLRNSDDAFVARLVGGPSLALDLHPYDQTVVVAAQVSSQPLRRPTPVVRVHPSAAGGIDTTVPFLDSTPGAGVVSLSSQINASLSQMLAHLNTTRLWTVACIRPNDRMHPGTWEASRVSAQVRAMFLPELTARRKVEYVTEVDVTSFAMRYGLPGSDVGDVRSWATGQMGWTQGKDFDVGRSSVWMSYGAFKAAEDRLRSIEAEQGNAASPRRSTFAGVSMGDSINVPRSPGGGEYGDLGAVGLEGSQEDLVAKRSPGAYDSTPHLGGQKPLGPQQMANLPYGQPPGFNDAGRSQVWGSEWGGEKGGLDGVDGKNVLLKGNGGAGGPADEKDAKTVEEVESSTGRRVWVNLVGILTWWIPTVALAKIGRIKRPDMQMAWREKLALCELIALMCGIVIFYIIGFGKVLCPEKDSAWSAQDLQGYAGANDFYVAVRGKVYDLTKFWRWDHSDIPASPVTQSDMLELAGLDLSNYFPVPLNVGCPNVQSPSLRLQYANWSATVPTAVHTSGTQQSYTASQLYSDTWYPDRFLPYMQQYYKGRFVVGSKDLQKQANDATKTWAIYEGGVYDLTDYLFTLGLMGQTNNDYKYIDPAISSLFSQQPGADITEAINGLNLNATAKSASLTCMKNLFYVGDTDFRETPRCTVQNYLLLAFTIILASAILVKFLAALQLGTKRFPELRDKFVICQVPCYTEDEESLRKTIDSLSVLKYDDKRKLIFVICDGMIIGSGNDRPTPRIVLDILGVEPDIDPEPMLFQSIGEGSRQLNYAKVYSGLYEVDGHVVPYVVVVKVGKPSERSKPGNRGKRDSQIMLMRWLNRVHFDAPMSPLELEITHQIRNVIGVEPQLYEFLFTVDADTEVTPDSLNRLVSAASDDARIIGICGETKLSNEKTSWWTMIQVYEYYISHHLSKAFESLFGSVTCLPGCFTLYRIRTADKGRPLVVSHLVIDDYSEIHVDTLHKKNLFSLGEDRYFTTLLLKHFPYYKTKFVADATAMTTAPETWAILLSQRRRWINSTIHNLGELLTLKNMCGFCCFSMRFFVFIDLLGTIILPATTVYIVYLIIEVATGAPLPLISIIILGAVYGLQAIIFLLKREWSLIFWLIIYLMAYPIYSFFLPIYSFWHMDDFSWGNTRIVVGEGKHKKVLADNDDEGFEPSMIPLRKFADYQAGMWEEEAKSVYTGGMPAGRPESVGGFSLTSRHVPAASVAHSLHQYAGSNMGMGGFPTSQSYAGSLAARSRQPSGGMSAFGAVPTIDRRSPNGSPARTPAGSVVGLPGGMGPGGVSEFGGFPGMTRPMMPTHGTMMSMGGMSMMSGPQWMPSVTSMAQLAPSNTQMDLLGAQSGMMMPAYPSMMSMNDLHARNMSMFSLAGLAGNNAAPGINPGQPVHTNPTSDPTDEELTAAIRSYLATQDLMSITKKTTRTALAKAFPNADLTGKKDFINGKIDEILAGN